jgi:hypothetical protein
LTHPGGITTDRSVGTPPHPAMKGTST